MRKCQWCAWRSHRTRTALSCGIHTDTAPAHIGSHAAGISIRPVYRRNRGPGNSACRVGGVLLFIVWQDCRDIVQADRSRRRDAARVERKPFGSVNVYTTEIVPSEAICAEL